MRDLLHDHSLSLTASLVLVTWLLLYAFWNPNTHWGSFFGNAIADWSGVVVMMLVANYLYEKGSSESNAPPPDAPGHPLADFARDHSLTIFLAITLAGWVILYLHADVNGKWGQVVGNVVSEWVQSIGMVLLTKKFIERRQGKNAPA
ncbi:MAG: hypothetical protein ACRD1C_12635 [Terriglobales bacterium]